MKLRLKMMKPGLPDPVWVSLKTEGFDKEVKELTKQLVPIYKKHFIPIVFYNAVENYKTYNGKCRYSY